jgi:uncharacterized damage-inducible protein DinB
MATEQAISLTTFYAGWEGVQRNLVKIIAPLTPEQLALRAVPHQWSIGMVAQHIVGNRVWWFHLWMGEGGSELAPIAHWDPQDEERQFTLDAGELVAGLKSTWQMIQEALDSWTPADLEQVFSPPSFLSEEEKRVFGDLSRQWIIWHVLEHEILHAGEISLVLGMNGLGTFYGV